MIVDQVRHQCGSTRCELSARVRSEAWAEEEFTLWYRVPAAVIPDHGSDAPDCSPFLAALLLWCLRRSEPLRIEGRVSKRLVDNAALASDICRSFWPDIMSAVDVTGAECEPGPGVPGAASFFTRGVDSWYTALTHGDRPYDTPPLTHLIYVPTVDFMLDEAHRVRAIESTEAAASALGMTAVIVETNLREHTERFLHWGYYHGAGLASIGLVLGFSHVLLPGARSYAQLVPEGSHPLLDPLWSTARTEIVHHGAEASRWDKVRHLADAPVALHALKVCFDENTDGNCGRCPKCIVTMVMLEAVGKLEECPFDRPLDRARVARLHGLPESLVQQLSADVLPELRDRRLALAIQAVCLRGRADSLGRSMRHAFGALRRLPSR